MRIRPTVYFKRTASDILYYLSKRNNDKENNSFRILLYHSIGQEELNDTLGIRIPKESFFEQMKLLYDNKYNVIGLLGLINLLRSKSCIPKRSIAITFDDGYKDNLTEAIPILREFNFPASVFVCVDYLEPGKKETNDYWTKWDFLTTEDLYHLLNYDIEIGLHSMTHRRLANLNHSETNREIAESKIKLENYLNKKVVLFSYPHGAFNKRVIGTLKANGFIAACCSRGGKNNLKSDFYKLKRIEITKNDNINEFKKKIYGCYDIIYNLNFKNRQ